MDLIKVIASQSLGDKDKEKQFAEYEDKMIGNTIRLLIFPRIVRWSHYHNGDTSINQFFEPLLGLLLARVSLTYRILIIHPPHVDFEQVLYQNIS